MLDSAHTRRDLNLTVIISHIHHSRASSEWWHSLSTFFTEGTSRLSRRLLALLPDGSSAFWNSKLPKQTTKKTTQTLKPLLKTPLFSEVALAQECVRNLASFGEGSCRCQLVFVVDSCSDPQQDNHDGRSRPLEQRHSSSFFCRPQQAASGIFPFHLQVLPFAQLRPVWSSGFPSASEKLCTALLSKVGTAIRHCSCGSGVGSSWCEDPRPNSQSQCYWLMSQGSLSTFNEALYGWVGRVWFA